MPTQRGTTPGRLTLQDWNRVACPGIHGVNNLVNKTVAPVRTVGGVHRGPDQPVWRFAVKRWAVSCEPVARCFGALSAGRHLAAPGALWEPTAWARRVGVPTVPG